MSIFFFSPSSFLDTGSIKSSVTVEALVKTKDYSVDIDAESTKTITTPIKTGVKLESI